MSFFRGVSYSFSGTITKTIIQLFVGSVLVHKINPHDYGFYVEVMIIFGFIALFADLGQTVASVAGDEPTNIENQQLFSLIIYGAILCFICLSTIAWLLHEFIDYGIQKSALLASMSLIYLFQSMSLFFSIKLNRRLDFQNIAIVEVVSVIFGSGAAIILAVLDFGFWSLYGLALFTSISSCFLYYSKYDEELAFKTEFYEATARLKKGWSVLKYKVVNYCSVNLVNLTLVLGYGSIQAGFYNRSSGLVGVASGGLLTPILSVLFPYLARDFQGDAVIRKEKLSILLAQIYGYIFFAIFFGIAPFLEIIYFGPAWEGVSDYLKLLSFILLVEPVGSLITTILNSRQAPDKVLIIKLFNLLIILMSIPVAFFKNEYAFIAVYAVGAVFVRLPFMLFVFYKTVGFRSWRKRFIVHSTVVAITPLIVFAYSDLCTLL